MIDLRSDTVTKPTPAMSAAMATAEVGDDALGEDPTVQRLECRAAEILGKEAALFVTSGTMANTIAVKLHTHHGEEIICADRSHIADWELSMVAWFAGCSIKRVAAPDGILSWNGIGPNINPRRPVFSATTLIALEHPHNMCGGTLYPLEWIDEICGQAHARSIRVHLDGSRIFNAAAATGIPPSRIADRADTVMFCLSKGLGAPVGSMLLGPADMIARARVYRRSLGGGWRQAGVLAAAGLVALEEMPARLPEDHANARRLAEGLAPVPGIAIEPARVVTNILIFDIAGTGLQADRFAAALRTRGVLASMAGGTRIRMVTHFGITPADCDAAVEAVQDILCGAQSTITRVAMEPLAAR